MNQEEQNYLNLLRDIVINGSKREDRTGVGTKSIFGASLRFSLRNDKLPLLTTKKMFTRGIIEELLFFLRGETDTKILESKNVNIWKGNTSREFLDKRGLYGFSEGEMGTGYGWQWRNFGGSLDGAVKGIDQIANALNLIKNDPYSRRILVSAWNPQQEITTALVPCHYSFQFYVNDGELSCLWNQRSVDSFLGLPFNCASYAILTHIFAKACNLKPGELIFNGGDTHYYLNHENQILEQSGRDPYDFPTLKINKELHNLLDIESLSFEDFEVLNYKSHPAIKAEMAV